MKILIVTDQFPPACFGGMATHAYNIARYLGKHHEVLVVILHGQKDTDYENERFSVLSLLTKRFPRINFIIIFSIAHYFKPDVIHVCTAGMVNKMLSRRYSVVTRVVGNDFLRPWMGYNLPLRSFLYRIPGNRIKEKIRYWETVVRKRHVIDSLIQSKLIVSNSTWTRDRLIFEGVPFNKTAIIVGGLDTEIFHPAENKDKIRRRLGFNSSQIILLTVANLVMKKNIDTVLKAVATLLPKWPDLHYIIIGDGKDGINFKKLASDLKLKNNTIFTGRKNHKAICEYYQAADIYVQPSRNHRISGSFFDVETMGRTYFEAGACGLPVIAADVGGVIDVVKNEINGLLVNDPEDHKEVAYKIKIILKDEKLRSRLGAQGLKIAKERFSWNFVGKAFEENLIAFSSNKKLGRK